MTHPFDTKGLRCDAQPLVNTKIERQVSPCQSVIIRDIIEQYPTGYEGGTHDSYGRSTDRRGGSAETENASRYHQEVAARGADTRLQVRGGLASQVSRSGEVYRGSEVQEEELISVSSVTAHSALITIGTRLNAECWLAVTSCLFYDVATWRVKGTVRVAGGGIHYVAK